MRNWPLTINHSRRSVDRSVGRSIVHSVVRSVVRTRSVPGPPWAHPLPNQFKWFRKALPLHHLSPCNRHRLHVYALWWSTCVGGCCTVLRVTHIHTQCSNNIFWQFTFAVSLGCSSRLFSFLCITILIAVKILTRLFNLLPIFDETFFYFNALQCRKLRWCYFEHDILWNIH